ncbi:uncharacterized protein LOC124620028 [Schistocerca americana]|uniref:uncharacterized protein LOC124620028 n=1 Tax=Schistocerca americana TaxID=7009 RepID=UPI001F4FB573|nr:uncharacterized protein LOC124620028 [Schistocerca americana]
MFVIYEQHKLGLPNSIILIDAEEVKSEPHFQGSIEHFCLGRLMRQLYICPRYSVKRWRRHMGTCVLLLGISIVSILFGGGSTKVYVWLSGHLWCEYSLPTNFDCRGLEEVLYLCQRSSVAKMALLSSRIFFNSHRPLSVSAARLADKMMADPIEHATGKEKRELLAQLAGNDDPYHSKAIKRMSTSSKANPNPVPSAFDSRIVGCICEEDATHIKWMWVYKGIPTRCACGHWFQLVEKPPL